MSKQKLKRVRVKLKDITVCDNSPHYARWDFRGVFQKWLSRSELEMIVSKMSKNQIVTMRLVKQIKKRKKTS